MSTIPDSKLPAVETTAAPSAEADVPGIRPAAPGLQPVTDLAAFLQSLPDFKEDAARLREAIAEDRELRRRMAEAENC